VSARTEVVLRAEGISKVFGGTVALNGVDFNVYHGKVSALVGENGAGKSTLIGVLAGVHQPTAGQILLDGEPVQLHSPRAAGDHGIRLIHQELLLFPNLSVAENIFAGSELQSLTGVRLREQEQEAARLLERLGQRVNPRTLVGDLAVGAQQMVAICKALSQQVRVLIMDEPTSALSTREVESLFRVVRALVADGVAVVYISHRLEEIIELGDFVTVLRDGRLVAEAAVPEIDSHWIVEHMIGRDPEALFPYESRPVGALLLEVEDLTLPRPRGGLALDRISFSLAAGEIVGIYGLMGAGRTELLQSLLGERRDAVGRILLDGVRVDGKTIGARIERGLFLVPEDRQREGLVQALSVKQNVSLASLDELGSFGSLSLRREAREVGVVVRERRRQGPRHQLSHHRAVGRKPAEGRRRKGTVDRSEGAADGRSPARGRRRCEDRALPDHEAPRERGHRDPLHVVRPDGGARDGGSHPRHGARPHHARVRPRRGNLRRARRRVETRTSWRRLRDEHVPRRAPAPGLVQLVPGVAR